MPIASTNSGNAMHGVRDASDDAVGPAAKIARGDAGETAQQKPPAAPTLAR